MQRTVPPYLTGAECARDGLVKSMSALGIIRAKTTDRG
jgi:hypothetical protein